MRVACIYYQHKGQTDKRVFKVQPEIYLSVVIPTCQRNDLLARCLDCLSPGNQTFKPALYEVIVTDDGRASTAQALIKQRYPWAKWTQGPKLGPAANRNHGAKQATGLWLAFVDDDCLPDKDWLKTIAEVAGTYQLDVIEGRTITPDKVDDPFKLGVENVKGGSYWSCNLAVKRARFLEIAGFDEDFREPGGEDMEFGYRVAKLNLRAQFVKEALVLHPVRAITFKGVLWRTFLIRWVLLCRHKTGQAIPLTDSALKAVILVAVNRLTSVARATWRYLNDFKPHFWRHDVFWHLWHLLTLPIVIPYLMYWELRFRHHMRWHNMK